jgi:hypothetical protein
MKYEPIFTDDPMFDKIANRIYESYKNACILYIDEVVNPELEEKFRARHREILNHRGDVTEKQYFHGCVRFRSQCFAQVTHDCRRTKESLVDQIAQNGFDPKYSKRTSYGYGVYFARNASYSSDFMFATEPGNPTYMFLSDVLVGKVRGEVPMRGH